MFTNFYFHLHFIPWHRLWLAIQVSPCGVFYIHFMAELQFSVRSNDRPVMSIAVCSGRKATTQNIWAWLFKTNDDASLSFVKFSEVDFSNVSIFFYEKMREAFLVQKLLSFFQHRVSMYLVIKW